MTSIKAKRCFSVTIIFLALLSCKTEPLNKKVEDDLKNTMRTFLYNSINNDSSKVKYSIEQVIYYPEENSYDCEFKVRMRLKNLDTMGTMRANISKDLKTVRRTL